MKFNLVYINSQPTIAFAANELEDYIVRIFPNSSFTHNENTENPSITIKVESSIPTLPPVKTPKQDDQYKINIGDKGGEIVATNPRSVLLAVYCYLELLGCRFLRPGKEYEIVPTLTKLPQISHIVTASLRHRGSCIEGANSLENILEFIDWLPKIGCNTFYSQFKSPVFFLQLWYNHKFNPMLSPSSFNEEAMAAEIDNTVAQRGLFYHKGGHVWTAESVGLSSNGWVESDDEGDSDFLAQINGRRKLFQGIPINTQLCYTNPEVISRMVQNIADYAQSHKDIDYLHVWLADEHNNFCECENCRDILPSDQYIDLLNAVDKELELRELSTKIVMLLYQELLWPPNKPLLNPQRFVLMFAPISRSFKESYNPDALLPKIPEYKLNDIKLPNSIQENMAFLKEWQKKISGDGFIYDYHLGRAHYGDMGYVEISRVLHRDIKRIADLGLNGMVACQELRAFLPNALPNYILGKTSINTNRSFEEIVEEYYLGAYGENRWKEVLDYLSELSKLCDCDYFNGHGSRKNLKLAAQFKEINILAKDFSAVALEGDSLSLPQKNFWNHLSYHKEYVLKLSSALEALTLGEEEEAKKRWNIFSNWICSNELSYQKALDVYRIHEVAGKYTGF